MIHEEHIRLCDDCGSILVHGICPLCGHREMEGPPDGPDGPDELDFEQTIAVSESVLRIEV